MKTATETNDIQRHGVVDKIQCGMQPTAHSFQMLARQYSDPVKAILQELGANAQDSHIRAGIAEKPFRVQLPTQLDSHIRVRDFGVSMSPEVMRNVYANYMKSDKQHTDDETGYFGIGSKTPLAYGDSFNITTYLNGKMRLYTMCYGEEGIPELNIFGEHNTDEPDGVEISFAVKEDDYHRFKQRAEHVYSFFTTAPTVNGDEEFALKTYNRVLEGEGWYFTGKGDTAYVIMGNIAYPVETWQIPSDSPAVGVLKNGVHFTVPMGSVHMTPSRESLEYNSHTINNIVKRCEEIAEEAAAQVIEELDACHSQWSASLRATELKSKFNTENWNLDSCKYDFIKTVDLSDLEFEWRFKYYLDGNKVKRSIKIDGDTRDVSKRTKIVIQDSPRGFDRPCRILSENEGQDNNHVVFLVTDTDKQAMMDELGCIEEDGVVILVSDLPKPPKGPRSPYARKTTRTVKKFCPDGDSGTKSRAYESRYWDADCEIDPNDDHVYVNIDRYDTDFEVRTAITQCTLLGLDVPDVIALTNQRAKLGNKPNFVHLKDWIVAELEELDEQDLKDRAARQYAIGQLGLAGTLNQILSSASIKITDPDSPAQMLIDYAAELGDETDSFVSTFRSLAVRAEYNFEYDKEATGFEELESEVKSRYAVIFTLWNELGYWKQGECRDMIVRTINSLDTAANCGG